MDTNQFKIPIKALTYNTAYRIYRNRFCLTQEAKNFKKNVQDYLRNNYNNLVCSNKPMVIYIEVGMKTKRRFDLDNVLKLIIDSFKGILYTDDHLIYEIYCKKFINQPNDFINIEVKELNEKID